MPSWQFKLSLFRKAGDSVAGHWKTEELRRNSMFKFDWKLEYSEVEIKKEIERAAKELQDPFKKREEGSDVTKRPGDLFSGLSRHPGSRAPQHTGGSEWDDIGKAAALSLLRRGSLPACKTCPIHKRKVDMVMNPYWCRQDPASGRFVRVYGPQGAKRPGSDLDRIAHLVLSGKERRRLEQKCRACRDRKR